MGRVPALNRGSANGLVRLIETERVGCRRSDGFQRPQRGEKPRRMRGLLMPVIPSGRAGIGEIGEGWGDRRGSNPQQPEPQSGALPLSYGHHRGVKTMLFWGRERNQNPAVGGRAFLMGGVEKITLLGRIRLLSSDGVCNVKGWLQAGYMVASCFGLGLWGLPFF